MYFLVAKVFLCGCWGVLSGLECDAVATLLPGCCG